MLPTPPHAGRCIYCAFRIQQSARQARRLRSTAATKTIHIRPSNGPNIVYEAGLGSPSTRDNPRPRKPTPLSEDSKIRSLLDGKRKGKFSSEKVKENFSDALHKRVTALKDELKDAPVLQHLRQEAEEGNEKAEKFDKLWRNFCRNVLAESEADSLPWIKGSKEGDSNRQMRTGMREAYRIRGNHGLDERIKYAFYGHVTGARFTESDIRNQKALADLRYPAEWFPATRSLHRTVHLHVGPTNSGKTYQALKRLEQAESGVYAGPLRLLAHEVYTRMNAKGRPCALITGEERRSPEGKTVAGDPDLTACTVEMMPVNKTLDVAVIDEIQMIGNNERGWAWTQALMGVKAREVHLCGEERTVPLIQELCASVGDKLEIHKYERLSPLQMADQSLNGDMKKLRKGDCIVSFSVIGIHALRKQIEQQTGRKVATVYGSLPPETRAQQARLFNDPDNDYDYLVASDAVGMGLNLAIKRIIFEASSKFDGIQRRTLGIADIKQIAGRAGRYRTAAFNATAPTATQDLAAAKGDAPVEVLPVETGANKNQTKPDPESENIGLVTTLEPFDFPIVQAAMTSQPEPIRTAGIFPPASVLERFASYFPPGTPFSYILIRLHELSQMHSRFHLCGLKEQIWIADLIEQVKGLTITDRNVICSAPASRSDDMWRALMPAYARCIAEQRGGSIVEIEELPLEILEAPVSASREYLRELERLHKGIVTYLWLSYRFAGIFSTRGLAFYAKGLVEGKIEEVLGKFSFSEVQRRKVAAKREREVLREMESVAGVGVEGGGEEGNEEGKVVDEGEEDDGPPEVFAAEEREAEEHDAEAQETEAELLATVPGDLVDEERGSLVAGGDRFAGEEDVAIEDPIDAEPAEEAQSATSNFALWRTDQTRGESQGFDEPGEDAVLGDVVAESEAEALAANDELETPSKERPSIADVAPEEAAAVGSDALAEVASPEQDVTDVSASVTPETQLKDPEDNGEWAEPLETQVEPPQAVESRTAAPDLSTEEGSEEIRRRQRKDQEHYCGGSGGSGDGGGASALHAHVDNRIREGERHAEHRP